MSATTRLSTHTVLARTSEGTRQMAARDPALGSKLRSALFLVSGRQTIGEMLALAGGLAHVLDAQLRTLLEMQLVVIVDQPNRSASVEPLPLAAARIQILKRIEAAGADVAEPIAGIRRASSLAELAQQAREAAIAIQRAMGRHAAEEFWTHARAILLHWQERDGAHA
jgi:hypothetical protein